MDEKIFSKEEIIRAIEGKYKSVEKYAVFKKKSRQSIYKRAENQTQKFLLELVNDGILLTKEPDNDYKVTAEFISPQIIKLLINITSILMLAELEKIWKA